MKWRVVASIVLLVVLAAFAGLAIGQEQGWTDFTGVNVTGTSATATPLVKVNQSGAGVPFEVQVSSTPVFRVLSTGVQINGVTQAGTVRYGAYTVTTTGYYTIAHGVGTTPTMGAMQASTMGYTASVTSLDTTSIYGRGSALAAQTVMWVAGK